MEEQCSSFIALLHIPLLSHFFFFKTHVLLIGSFHLRHIFFFTGYKKFFLFFKNIQIKLLHTKKNIRFSILKPITSNFPLAFSTKPQVCFYLSPIFHLFILLFLISNMLIWFMYILLSVFLTSILQFTSMKLVTLIEILSSLQLIILITSSLLLIYFCRTDIVLSIILIINLNMNN